MQSKIDGTVMQMLTVTLNKGESVYTESGGMAWMTGGLEMSTNTRGGLPGGGIIVYDHLHQYRGWCLGSFYA